MAEENSRLEKALESSKMASMERRREPLPSSPTRRDIAAIEKIETYNAISRSPARGSVSGDMREDSPTRRQSNSTGYRSASVSPSRQSNGHSPTQFADKRNVSPHSLKSASRSSSAQRKASHDDIEQTANHDLMRSPVKLQRYGAYNTAIKQLVSASRYPSL